MADRRRNRPPNRPPRAAAPLTGEIAVDDETAAALAIFNARLSHQADVERGQRRIDKATREKDQAAARVRALESDTKATAEQRAEATAAYKASVEALERAKKGEPAPTAVEPAHDEQADVEAPDEQADDAAPEPEATLEVEQTEDAAEAAEPSPTADTDPDAVEPRDADLDEAPASDS
jgi:hypothetical protein